MKDPIIIIIYLVIGAVFFGVIKAIAFSLGKGRVANKSVKENPDDPETWYIRAKLFMENDSTYDKDSLIQDFQKAIELKENYYEAWFELGRAYYLKHDYQNSIDSFNKVFELTDDVEFTGPSTFNLACIHWDIRKFDECIEYLNKAGEITSSYYANPSWNQMLHESKEILKDPSKAPM